MDATHKEALTAFKRDCVSRLGERLKRFIVSTREKKFLVVVVADDLSEREEYRLYRTAADFALKNRFLLFVFPYSSSDFRRRENLAFITRIVSEGEEL